MSRPEGTELAVGEMEARGLDARGSLSEDSSFSNLTRQPVYILAAGRTAIAPAHGPLSMFELHDLVEANWKALSSSIRLHTPAFSERDIQAVFLGNGLAAGGNPARLCALATGFDYSVPGLTVDTQCCSGLDAVGLATSRIATGDYECVLAGGAESASNAPLRARRSKDGSLAFYSEAQFAPSASLCNASGASGTSDVSQSPSGPGFGDVSHPSMAQAARALAHGMDLQALYQYAIDSHERVLNAAHPDLLSEFEEAAISRSGPSSRQDSRDLKSAFGRDSHPRRLSMALCERGERNAIHNPATMTPLADASCLLVLASQRKVRALNARPLAQVLGHYTVGADPSQPALAVNQILPWLEAMLERHTAQTIANGTSRATIAVELMESFSAQAILNRQALADWAHQLLQTKAWAQDIWTHETGDTSEISETSKTRTVSADAILDINPHGGLLALGHPIGASGAILVARLAHRLGPNQLGVAIIPAAGGLASAMLLKGCAPPRPR